MNDAVGGSRTACTIGYFASFLVFGMGVAALGPSLPRLAQNTASTLSRISLVFSATAAGYLLGSLAAGALFDRLPGHWILGGVLILMAVMAACVLLAASPGCSPFVPTFGAAQGWSKSAATRCCCGSTPRMPAPT